jgi:hypothetical protein
MSHLPTPALTQLEFTPRDHKIAERIARRLGYQQYAYTSTSTLWGLFCLPENPEHQPGAPNWAGMRVKYPPFRGGCVIKTKELGFLFVQNTEDLGMGVIV